MSLMAIQFPFFKNNFSILIILFTLSQIECVSTIILIIFFKIYFIVFSDVLLYQYLGCHNSTSDNRMNIIILRPKLKKKHFHLKEDFQICIFFRINCNICQKECMLQSQVCFVINDSYCAYTVHIQLLLQCTFISFCVTRYGEIPLFKARHREIILTTSIILMLPVAILTDKIFILTSMCVPYGSSNVAR